MCVCGTNILYSNHYHHISPKPLNILKTPLVSGGEYFLSGGNQLISGRKERGSGEKEKIMGGRDNKWSNTSMH